jgi:hypothetical protein
MKCHPCLGKSRRDSRSRVVTPGLPLVDGLRSQVDSERGFVDPCTEIRDEKSAVRADVKIDRVWQARVRYPFSDESGHRQEGRSLLMPEPDAAQWTAGRRVYVRYDRLRPSKSQWIGPQPSGPAEPTGRFACCPRLSRNGQSGGRATSSTG